VVTESVGAARSDIAAVNRAIIKLAEATGPTATDDDEPEDDGDDDADAETGELPWFDVVDVDLATSIYGHLAGWLVAVYLQYPQAKLDACWMWHPDVVDELLTLYRGWIAAYYGPRASAAMAMDWHDRYRPGVVSRLATGGQAGRPACNLERHRPNTKDPAYVPPVVYGADLVGDLGRWWATARRSQPPAPTREMEEIVKADKAARRNTG